MLSVEEISLSYLGAYCGRIGSEIPLPVLYNGGMAGTMLNQFKHIDS
jgi:hypothetical protein